MKKACKLILLLSFLTLFIFSFILYKRTFYIPANFPERYFKVGKGYFEPSIPRGFAFHPNRSELYIIDDKNHLIVWDFTNNSYKHRRFPIHYKNKLLKIYDINEKYILLGQFDHNIHYDQLVIADLVSLQPIKRLKIKGRLSGARFDNMSNDILYSEITRISKERYELQNTTECHSWNPLKNVINKSEMCVDIDGIATFHVQKFNISSKDGKRNIFVDNQPEYASHTNKIINSSRIIINRDKVIENNFRYPVNSGAACDQKNLFCLVSSPSNVVVSPLSYHYAVYPTENLSSIFVYRYSTGEKIFEESFPYYPSYYVKFSDNEKWLGVSIGGYVLIYDIDNEFKFGKL